MEFRGQNSPWNPGYLTRRREALPGTLYWVIASNISTRWLRHAEVREEREGDDTVQQLNFASFASSREVAICIRTRKIR